MMTEFAQRFQRVQQRIETACTACNRDPNDITLLAVSKFHSAQAVRDLAASGQVDFGENYVQHLTQKMDELSDLNLNWHYIGGLQRNKVKYLAGRIALLHTLDSTKLLAEVVKQSEKKDVVTPCLIEVNVGGEQSKSGIAPEALAELVQATVNEPRVQLRGLMSIPPFHDEAEAMRRYHQTLRQARDEMQERFGCSLPVLSMGMSNDLEVAIEEGSTLVRVGTDLFGPREG